MRTGISGTTGKATSNRHHRRQTYAQCSEGPRSEAGMSPRATSSWSRGGWGAVTPDSQRVRTRPREVMQKRHLDSVGGLTPSSTSANVRTSAGHGGRWCRRETYAYTNTGGWAHTHTHAHGRADTRTQPCPSGYTTATRTRRRAQTQTHSHMHERVRTICAATQAQQRRRAGGGGVAVREGSIELRKIAGKLRENCGKIAGKLRCCNQTKLNRPKPQGATILHWSLRMLKQIESSTRIRITKTSGPQYHHEIRA